LTSNAVISSIVFFVVARKRKAPNLSFYSSVNTCRCIWTKPTITTTTLTLCTKNQIYQSKHWSV